MDPITLELAHLTLTSKNSSISLHNRSTITKMHYLFEKPVAPLVLATSSRVNFKKYVHLIVGMQLKGAWLQPLQDKRPSSTKNHEVFLLISSHQSDWKAINSVKGNDMAVSNPWPPRQIKIPLCQGVWHLSQPLSSQQPPCSSLPQVNNTPTSSSTCTDC